MSMHAWYNKHYQRLLFIPALILLVSLIFLGIFYVENGAIINRDVSLTGGTSYTITTDVSAAAIEDALIQSSITDFTVQSIRDGAGNAIGVIVTVGEEDALAAQPILESVLGFSLTDENSSIETTSARISEEFFNQLIVAVLLAFFWMAAIVFVIFSDNLKTKIWIIIGNLAFGIFLGNFFLQTTPVISGIIFFLFAGVFIYTYIKNSVPAFAVMLSAFADIVMTLAVVNMLGMKLSTGGIVAFLMLIGYSVDTDILLTTRILNNKKSSVNRILFDAFKTGMTMMVTSIIAIATALIVVYPFASVLNQIFIILLIGLFFDIFNTWITNASILKWYTEVKQ